MPRRAARTDANQASIVAALESVGALVHVCASLGGGFTDLIVGYRHRLYLLEVKDGNKPPCERKLTPAQVKFHAKWAEYAYVVENIEGAMIAIGAKIT